MKKLAVALALVLTAACSSTPMNSSSKDGNAGSTVFGASSVAAKSTDAPNYILFSSPNAVRNVDFSTSVYGLNLKGTITNRGGDPRRHRQDRCRRGQGHGQGHCRVEGRLSWAHRLRQVGRRQVPGRFLRTRLRLNERLYPRFA